MRMATHDGDDQAEPRNLVDGLVFENGRKSSDWIGGGEVAAVDA